MYEKTGKKNPQVDLERYSEIQEEDSKETNEDAYVTFLSFSFSFSPLSPHNPLLPSLSLSLIHHRNISENLDILKVWNI